MTVAYRSFEIQTCFVPLREELTSTGLLLSGIIKSDNQNLRRYLWLKLLVVIVSNRNLNLICCSTVYLHVFHAIDRSISQTDGSMADLV